MEIRWICSWISYYSLILTDRTFFGPYSESWIMMCRVGIMSRKTRWCSKMNILPTYLLVLWLVYAPSWMRPPPSQAGAIAVMIIVYITPGAQEYNHWWFWESFQNVTLYARTSSPQCFCANETHERELEINVEPDSVRLYPDYFPGLSAIGISIHRFSGPSGCTHHASRRYRLWSASDFPGAFVAHRLISSDVHIW